MRKKQQTTEQDSPDIIHNTPAALLLAENNLIHLNAGFSLLGHFFGVICSVFVYILFYL